LAANLSRGETVENKAASDAHAKTLAKWNAEGNHRTGGMAVTGHPRMELI
jgi:hypothetical protein